MRPRGAHRSGVKRLISRSRARLWAGSCYLLVAAVLLGACSGSNDQAARGQLLSNDGVVSAGPQDNGKTAVLLVDNLLRVTLPVKPGWSWQPLRLPTAYLRPAGPPRPVGTSQQLSFVTLKTGRTQLTLGYASGSHPPSQTWTLSVQIYSLNGLKLKPPQPPSNGKTGVTAPKPS